MQAQTTGRLREYRFNRGILIALAGIGLLIASIIGMRALTDEERVAQTPALSPAAAPVAEDPPLPAGWVDPYVEQSAVGHSGITGGVNSTTLGRATNSTIGFMGEGLISTPFNRSASSAIGFTDQGVNTTTLNLDQNGANVFPAEAISAVPASGTSQAHIVEAPQGEGLPMIVFEQAALRELAPQGEGLPMNVMDRAAAIDGLRSTDDSGLDYTSASAKEVRFLELNGVYAPTIAQAAGTADDQAVTVSDYQFLEENAWDYAPLAKVAGNPYGSSGTPNFRLIEENMWGGSPLRPNADDGRPDY